MKKRTHHVLMAGLTLALSFFDGQFALALIKPDPEFANSLQGIRAHFPQRIVVAGTTSVPGATEKPKGSGEEKEEEEELDEDDC